MPVVAPFSDFDLDDEIALQRYVEAHAKRHSVYSEILKISGGQQLRGTVDADWMARHWTRTVTLATYTGIDLSSADAKVLALPGRWTTQQQLRDWMDLDARFHEKVDRQLKL